MTNLTELKKQYEALGKEIAKLKESVTTDKWPQVGDEYWYVYEDGSGVDYMITRSFGEGKKDSAMLAIGNCFRIREEAEAERDARLVVAELKRQPGAKRFTPDCYSVFIYDNFEPFASITDRPNAFGQAYFDSYESCRNAIAAVGEDRILKAARWWAMGSAE